ncbi:phosphotransferase [Streptomyces sp. NPDC002573]|uniref:phosphotransferase n=1 Tax=Streptomyces sp. NPDC002573 TaxID=3364651 RepID=UPI0036875592
MSPECSQARQRAVEMSGDLRAVEGPLAGYHHETYVIPLPGEAVGPAVEGGPPVRGKVREPRGNLLWFDRRCFASEEALLHALRGRVAGIPELIAVAEGVWLQRFIEGRTLGSLHASGAAIPDTIAAQILDLFRQMARITPGRLDAERVCRAEDRTADGDTAGFLERLICFAESRVYRENLSRFPGLFVSLGVQDDSFDMLRKHVAGLTERPFCLLHADLHRENFVVDARGRLWTIDWELAMLGDPLYDLATHLHLMRYPQDQASSLIKWWCQVVETERPGSSRGWEQDLPRLLDFKRAQSVFTDVVRTTQDLVARPDPDESLLLHHARHVQRVLTAGAQPLGLDAVPVLTDVVYALGPFRRM